MYTVEATCITICHYAFGLCLPKQVTENGLIHRHKAIQLIHLSETDRSFIAHTMSQQNITFSEGAETQQESEFLPDQEVSRQGKRLVKPT